MYYRLSVSSAGSKVEGCCLISITDVHIYPLEEKNSLKNLQNKLFYLFKHHPLDAWQAAHLCRGMDRSHSVLCSSIQVAPGLLDEVLEDIKVALLGGKIHRRHSVLHPRVGTARGGRCDQCKIED